MQISAFAEDYSFGMNTEIKYRLFGEKAEAAVIDAKAEVMRLENILSRFIPNSEVSRINQHVGKDSVHVSPETYNVLAQAMYFSKISNGLFDITVGPLVDLWNYKKSLRAPEEKKIRQILTLINFNELIMNPGEKTVSLSKTGQSIDLGGVGKGYASDRCIEIFRKFGVTSAFVNIGGNVSIVGNKPDGSAWSVGIRHPRQNGCLLGAIKITDKSVVTSGDYERYFIDPKGRRWHHILNPTTGFPAESGLISVTVIADSAMTADALSTAIFVAGIDKGLGYLSQFPGTEAVLVDHRQKVFITQGINDYYQAAEGMEAVII